MGHKERFVGSLFRVDEPVPDDSDNKSLIADNVYLKMFKILSVCYYIQIKITNFAP